MDQQDQWKKAAAQKGVDYIRDGMIVGLGSGSTMKFAIELIGQKVKSGLSIKGVSSSVPSTELATQHGIELTGYEKLSIVDVNLDGADEVDPNFNLIKGGGGALLREKINAFAAQLNIILVDQTKMVEKLGRFPLPVEVNQFGHEEVKRTIERIYGIEVELRMKEDSVFVSDNGNYILDCFFEEIDDPHTTNAELMHIPGLVETGFFLGVTDILIIGTESGPQVRQVKPGVPG